MIRLVAAGALTVSVLTVAPAHAVPIPCPDGSTVEFGQFCPVWNPWAPPPPPPPPPPEPRGASEIPAGTLPVGGDDNPWDDQRQFDHWEYFPAAPAP